MFAEIDRMDVTMLVILATFAPAFLCAQLLEFNYKKLCQMFFGRSRRSRQCRFPKQYYLRCRIQGQVAWSRKVNMSFLRRYLATYVQYQVWIVRIHARKLKFLQKKPEEWSNEREKSDHPYDVQQEKLQRPMPHLVEALIHKMDPLGQYKNIKILTGPELLQSKKQKKAQKKVCKSALTYSSNLVPPKEYDIEQAKTVYFSRKDGEPPIVINSGASYSVTLNLQDFVGPIRECSTKELNGLNAPINVVGEGKVDWKIQDVFGTVRSIKTTA
jgi:hypothetical protein